MSIRLDINKIVEFRLNLGLSQRELAKKAGIAKGLVSKMEKSGRAHESTAKKLADAFGVGMREIVAEGFASEPSRPEETTAFNRIKEAMEYSGINDAFEAHRTGELYAVVLTDTQGTIGYVPTCFAKELGYEGKEELIGKNMLDVSNPSQILEMRRELANYGAWHGVIDCFRRDGSRFQTVASAFKLMNAVNNPVARVLLLRKAKDARLDDWGWSPRGGEEKMKKENE